MRDDEAEFGRQEGVWRSVSHCGDSNVGLVSEGDGGRGEKEKMKKKKS